MGTHWSFGTPDGKTVEALILPELTGSESGEIAQKLLELAGEQMPTARQVMAVLQDVLHAHGKYASKLRIFDASGPSVR
jgi:hypothetical protein